MTYDLPTLAALLVVTFLAGWLSAIARAQQLDTRRQRERDAMRRAAERATQPARHRATTPAAHELRPSRRTRGTNPTKKGTPKP